MLIGPELIYVHPPKTAGEWVTDVLVRAGVGLGHGDPAFPAPELTKHGSLAAIPAELCAGRALLATVRNPWAWYVSWYHYTLGPGGRERAEFNSVLSTGNDGSFREVLYRATHPDQADPSVVDAPWNWPGDRGVPTHDVPILRRMAEAGIGMCSYQVLRLLSRGWRPALEEARPLSQAIDVDALVDTASVSFALTRVLERLGVRVSTAAMLDCATRPRTNVAGKNGMVAHADPFSYYDDEMRGWVERADRDLIGMLGYRFGQVEATEPAWFCGKIEVGNASALTARRIAAPRATC